MRVVPDRDVENDDDTRAATSCWRNVFPCTWPRHTLSLLHKITGVIEAGQCYALMVSVCNVGQRSMIVIGVCVGASCWIFDGVRPSSCYNCKSRLDGVGDLIGE